MTAASVSAIRALPAAPGVCDIPGVGQVCPGNIVKAGWAGVIDSFQQAVGQTIRLLFTFWDKVPAPSLSETSGPVGELQRSLSWYVGLFAVASVLIGAARIAWSRRARTGVDLLGSVVRLLVVSAVGVPAVAALVAAGDGFSTWLLQRSAGGDFGARMTALGQTVALTTALGGGAASALTLLIAILAILGALAQAVVLVLRGAILVILTATLPLAASATNTDLGRQWWSKSWAWLIAFIVFKPAAALVYAGAFYLIGAGTDAQSVIAGLMTLALAAFTLPALMKLLVPAVASASSSVSAGEVLAVGGAMASGAVAVGQLGGKATTGSAGSGGGGAARDVTQTGGGPAGSGGGVPGPAGGGGSPGGSGSAGAGGTPAAGAAGTSAGAGAGAGGAAAGGGAAAAGAAAGPVGAAVAAGARVVQAGAAGAARMGNAAAGQDAGSAASRADKPAEQGDRR
jgi:type IV secretion system protein TrbL